MCKVFISHSTADESLVNEFCDLLQLGCNLRAEDIRCSSIGGAGIKVGADFIDWIEDSLVNSALVILLVTPNYSKSQYCLAEMGASWALRKEVFPITLPNQSDEAGVVLLGRQTAKLDSLGLDDLKDSIEKNVSGLSVSTGRWGVKKEDFLKKVPEIINNLPKPDVVTMVQFQSEQEKTKGAMDICDQLQSENELLKEQIRLLEQTKDAQEVTRVRLSMASGEDQYESLLKKARSYLDGLTLVESRCVYASIREDEWTPDRDDWDSYKSLIDKAKESEWIKAPFYDENAFFANEEHPRLKPIFEALNALNVFINESMTKELKDSLEAEKGCFLGIQNRQFWEDILFVTLL